MVSFLRRLLLSLAVPALVSACSCIDPTVTLTATLKRETSVFRGVVIRKLNDFQDYSNYVVRVSRVFKGCHFLANERIMVATGRDDSLCGMSLKVNGTYAFSGYRYTISQALATATQLESGSAVKKAVQVDTCEYNKKWSQVSPAELQQLRSFDNSKCRAYCTTGLDCARTHYCDANKCTPFNKPCATPLATCGAPPCSLVPASALCTEPSAKCYNDYCGGCNKFFLDSSKTRVCQ
jgi:Tissue inhibitor of metalloproteinase